MSVTTRSPLRFAGANLSSGSINTGELGFTRGGWQVVSQSGMFSGNPDGGVVLVSGVAGRVNQVIFHNNVAGIPTSSGVPLFLYDGNILTSGGPFAASGHKFLAVLNGPGGVSGQLPQFPGQVAVDMPFQSGLIARMASGGIGFSVSWTPEVNPNQG